MAHTPLHLTIDEPQPGRFTPERVLLVCPGCGHPFLRAAAILVRGDWTFPCPACHTSLTLNAMAGRSLRGHEQWVFLKSLAA